MEESSKLLKIPINYLSVISNPQFRSIHLILIPNLKQSTQIKSIVSLNKTKKMIITQGYFLIKGHSNMIWVHFYHQDLIIEFNKKYLQHQPYQLKIKTSFHTSTRVNLIDSCWTIGIKHQNKLIKEEEGKASKMHKTKGFHLEIINLMGIIKVEFLKY